MLFAIVVALFLVGVLGNGAATKPRKPRKFNPRTDLDPEYYND